MSNKSYCISFYWVDEFVVSEIAHIEFIPNLLIPFPSLIFLNLAEAFLSHDPFLELLLLVFLHSIKPKLVNIVTVSSSL